MKSGKKLLTGTLLALCIVLATGCGKEAKTNATLPEVRNNDTAIQWKYSDETDWHDLVALAELRDATGENGKDGADGKDGNTPFIGENGNWWIGETDTGVKAAGVDGTNGINGEKGDKGEKGDSGDKGEKGDKGDAGQNGVCAGYFYASNNSVDGFGTPLVFWEKINYGNLITWSLNQRTITLKKGHTYSITLDGSFGIYAKMEGWYAAELDDGGFSKECGNATFCYMYTDDRDNSEVWTPFSFTYIFKAEDDVVLQYSIRKMSPITELRSASYNIAIIALD